LQTAPNTNIADNDDVSVRVVSPKCDVACVSRVYSVAGAPAVTA
jgi:hypothetical protein